VQVSEVPVLVCDENSFADSCLRRVAGRFATPHYDSSYLLLMLLSECSSERKPCKIFVEFCTDAHAIRIEAQCYPHVFGCLFTVMIEGTNLALPLPQFFASKATSSEE
jgi:hypothetical protein